MSLIESIGTIISWLIGIFLLLLGLLFVVGGFISTAGLMILASIILIPITRKKIESKINYTPNSGVMAVSVIALVFISLLAFPVSDDSASSSMVDSENDVVQITETKVEQDNIDEKDITDRIEETDADVVEENVVENTQTITDAPITVGAFNIQVFGVSKADKPEVMDVLADVIRTYDIVAIQEIRDSSQTALPELVNLVNSDGSEYAYVVSERLGRTTSKEQYAYIYDTNTIELTGTAHTYPEPDGTDPFHRQPYITSFETIAGNYDAVLMVIHVDPDEATEEINALDDVFEYVNEAYPGEQDFILMGDLNADGSYYNEDSMSDISGSDYAWVIDNSQDTTVASSSNTYDRIILTDTSDYLGSGVFRFDTEYSLSSDETSAVSDHYPVYAYFQIDHDNDANSASTYVPVKTTSSTTTIVDTSSSDEEEEQDTSSSSGPIQISGISLSDEWVKIKNTGSSSISLKGWTILDDDDKHTYTFPSFTLGAGATVTVHTEEGTNTASDLYWGTGNVWNNDGDTARLYDENGNLVDTSD